MARRSTKTHAAHEALPDVVPLHRVEPVRHAHEVELKAVAVVSLGRSGGTPLPAGPPAMSTAGCSGSPPRARPRRFSAGSRITALGHDRRPSIPGARSSAWLAPFLVPYRRLVLPIEMRQHLFKVELMNKVAADRQRV